MAPAAVIAYRGAMERVLILLDGPAAPLVLGVLGAILGSFIAALVIRWPQGRSVIDGRSACDACGRSLASVELVPVLSAIWLRGKCRSCGARIDPVHLQVELAALLIGALSAWLLPGLAGLWSAVFGWLLLALAIIDARHFWLPDRLTGALAIVGLVVGAMGIGPHLMDRAIGGAAGYAFLWAIAAVYRDWRGRDGLGGGDPKLLGAIGLWIGWRLLPIVVVLASMAGLGVVLFWLLTGRGAARDDQLPFGTLLAIGAYPVWVVMLLVAA